jgi:hypothetical protein
MRSKIIDYNGGKYVILPKVALEQSGLSGTVEISVLNRALHINNSAESAT